MARASRAGPTPFGRVSSGGSGVHQGRPPGLINPEATNTTNDPNARFGAVSSNIAGTIGSATSVGHSAGAGRGSSGILAGLRATASVTVAPPAPSSTSEHSSPADKAAPRIVPDERPQASSQPESLDDVITRRIRALFATATSSASYGSSSSRRQRNAPVGLSADFILSRFRDIGDHYAPIFRSVLRQVATMNKDDKKWYLRK